MKTVVCRCHCAWPLCKDAELPWADVWVSLKARRKTVYYCPVLLSRPDAEADLELTQSCQENNPDLDYREDIAAERRVLACLDTQGYYVGPDDKRGCSVLALDKEWLTRRDAERLLTIFLRERGYKTALKFKWKRPEMVIGQMTFRTAALDAVREEEL